MEQDPTQIFRPFDEIQWSHIGLIIVAAWSLTFFLERLLPWIAQRMPPKYRVYVLPFVPGLRLVILVVAHAQVAILILRPTPENIFALLGAAGFAIGFAFKDYVSSLVAGVVVTAERPYRPGDWVQIGDVYGEVKSVGLRAVDVLTADDTLVTIPHARIWTDAIKNANDGARDHLCVADFYVDPEHDAAAVRAQLYDVAITSPFLHLARPVSVVLREELWATHYRVKAYPVDNRDEFAFVSDLTVRGKTALAQLGASPPRAPALARAAAPKR